MLKTINETGDKMKNRSTNILSLVALISIPQFTVASHPKEEICFRINHQLNSMDVHKEKNDNSEQNPLKENEEIICSDLNSIKEFLELYGKTIDEEQLQVSRAGTWCDM